MGGRSNREHFAVAACGKLLALLKENGCTNAILTSWVESQRLLAFSYPKEFATALKETQNILWKNAVPRLQIFEQTEWNFLYSSPKGSRQLVMNSGVARLLVTFSAVLKPIIERRFAQIVEKLNPKAIGVELSDTIYAHLFLENDRVMPSPTARKKLMELQGKRCIWTGELVHEKSPADHVVPWHRRSISVIENFVLSTPSANSSKSSHLLSANLLERWLMWLGENLQTLADLSLETNLLSNPERCVSALIGLYSNSTRAPLWDGPGIIRRPDDREQTACRDMALDFSSAHFAVS